MWNITITNPGSEPVQIKLKPGKMLIGRRITSDIVVTDSAASRRHAEIYLDSISEMATITDLNSSNGTYVNHQKIKGLYRLQNDDVIRIGQTVMHLTKIANEAADQQGLSGTRLFNRELVLEAVDENPMLLYEITEKLNTVVDLESAIAQVIDLTKRAIGVDVCEIILAKDFNTINMEAADSMVVRAIKSSAVETSPMEMCVPIVGGGKPLGLIRLEKNRPEASPFIKRDMQFAVAVSHQTALTIQRMELLVKIHTEQQVKQLLLRFVSPIEAEYGLKDFLKTGKLPDLAEKKVTVLFVEIADATGFAKRIGPNNFSAFLNAFYQNTTQVVFKKGGMVKYLGDGVLAVFMETQDKTSPEERAVRVALEIIEYITRTYRGEPDNACVIGVAINTGKAMVGYAGTQERAEFNVMGDLIKVTYRMQEYAQPNRMFVGPVTAEAIRNKYVIQKVGNLAMRGHEVPIQVFEVSLPKTEPFIQEESDMSEAFKEIAEKLKAKMKDNG
jgi:class 3 adenylate cyclase